MRPAKAVPGVPSAIRRYAIARTFAIAILAAL